MFKRKRKRRKRRNAGPPPTYVRYTKKRLFSSKWKVVDRPKKNQSLKMAIATFLW